MQTYSETRWEELFEQATEDVSTYHWAASQWPESPEGYDPDYLLIQALGFRARSRLALEVLRAEDELAGDYPAYLSKLDAIHRKAEAMLGQWVENRAETMEAVLEDQGVDRLDRIGTILETVRRIAEDGILFGDPEWFAEARRDNAHDFLLLFQDAFLAKGEIVELFPGKVFAPNFQGKLDRIERRFREDFHCFDGLDDLFAAIREREYHRSVWWLDAPFADEEEAEETLPAELEAVLRQMGDHWNESGVEDCPEAENVLALAAAELEAPEEYARVRAHIHECDACLDLYLDVRADEAESLRNPRPIAELPQGLYDAIYGQTDPSEYGEPSSIPDGVRDMFDRISGYISDSLRHLDAIFRDLQRVSLQPIYMKEDRATEKIELKSPVHAKARFEDGSALLEKPKEETDQLSKIFRILTGGKKYRSKILGMDAQGCWAVLEGSRPVMSESENDIRLETGEHGHIVWLMDPGLSALGASTRAVLAVLNRESSPEKAAVKNTTIAVWIEVEGGR
jgi:hypothetical protein